MRDGESAGARGRYLYVGSVPDVHAEFAAETLRSGGAVERLEARPLPFVAWAVTKLHGAVKAQKTPEHLSENLANFEVSLTGGWLPHSLSPGGGGSV